MMELRHERLGGFRPVFNSLIRQEETLESIVPDALPDISRIIEVSGIAFLRQRETVDGSVRVMGTVRTTVLYLPEGGTAPCSLTLNIPYLCNGDHPSIREGCRTLASVNVISADAQTVNPRKVLARIEIAVTVSIYAEDHEEICVNAEDSDDCGLQTLTEVHKDFIATDVVEKNFSFSDVLRLPASKPAVGQLLSSRVGLSCAEARVIGKKLVVKGEAALSVLYCCEDGVTAAKFDLPYSQIMETHGGGEDCDVKVEVMLTGISCELRSDSELEVNLELLFQAAVRQEREVSLLADLYSITEPVSAERGKVRLTTLVSQGARRQIAQQFCPTTIPAKLVVDCRLTAGEVSQASAGEGTAMLTAKTYADVLYLNGENELCTASYVVPVTWELPVPSGSQCACKCSLVGEVTAVPVAGGLEVRFEAELSYRITCSDEVGFVTAVRQEQTDTSSGERPSIVIRMVGEGERLWDVAKCCGSTVADIQTVNSLVGGDAPSGTLLLIPKSR